MTGSRIGSQLSLATGRELIQAIAGRYHSAARSDKKKIINEFTEVTGFHRKHAIRVLRKTSGSCATPAPRSRLYDEAVRGALTILWEEADRICGKRLKEAIPTLVDAIERHGHLHLGSEVRRRLLRNFTRDNIPEEGCFERLQDTIYDGVIDTAESKHADGYERVKKTIAIARTIQIDSHPLKECLEGYHRSGVCHQLANEDRLKWVP
jgi:hypothetical protein